MKTRVCPKDFVNDCLWKQFLAKLVLNPIKFDLFDKFCDSKAFDTVLT